MLDAFGAPDRQSPDHRTSKEHGARAQRQRDRHVRAASDPAVDQHLDAVADGVGHLG